MVRSKHDVHVESHEKITEALELLLRSAVVASEVGANLLFLLVEKRVVNRGDGVDDNRAILVFFSQKRADFVHDLIEVIARPIRTTAILNLLDVLVVLSALFRVDYVRLWKLD